MSLAPQTQDKEFDARAFARSLMRFKWVVIASTLLVGAGATLWTLRQPKDYRAQGVIEFDPSPPRPLGEDVQDVSDPVSSFWSLREYYATQLRILESRTIAERVAEKLGLHHDATFFGADPSTFESRSVTAAANRLLGKLKVSMIKETRLVKVRVEDTDPERAATLANAVIEAYIEKTMADRMASSVSALDWLGEQLDSLRDELGESELALHRFKEEHNVLSVSMEDRQNLLAGEIEAFNSALTEARQSRIQLAARASRLRSSLEGVDPLEVSVPQDTDRSTLPTMQEALRTKLTERASFASRYGENHPRMQQLTSEIETLREQISTALEALVVSASADLREAREVEGELRAALEEAHSAGLRLNLREIEYERLNRERENKAKLYELVLSRSTETNLTRMMHSQTVRVVDSALVPSAPFSPNVPLNVAMGLLFGFILGVGVSIGIQFLDRRLKSPDDVEQLGISVLGILPGLDKDRGGETGAKPDLIVHNAPMSEAAECCRTIRTNLTFMAPDDPIRSFVVSSPTPQEGKTTVASNIATSMAHAGKKVLLVDTDLRRPRVHKAFDLPNEAGVTSVVVGAMALDDAVCSTEVPGLSVLSSGPIPPNPSELLHGRGFEAMMSEALRKYDRVILDSPPLGAVTDAAVLSTYVRGVVLVVKAEHTTRDGLRHALRQLHDVSADVLGVIMNNVDSKSSRYGYYQYYRYRYTPDEDGSAQLDAAE